MASDYAFIRAYCKYIEAREPYLDDLVRRARRENAHKDVYAYDDDAKRWILFSELEAKAEGDAAVAEQVKTIRAIMR
ncbi:hypothetical protein [Methylocapsa acidiphila]|uniref:hypothetical protein n=1 Tax=Methylocapsa acidiphila TaxID=133552 RepID=UPI000406ADEE|nr:hypothetical protein [Methylocapsa acidiphila]